MVGNVFYAERSDHGRIPRPPLAEQRRIISYLDERCAAIDEDVAKRRDVIGKLKEYKKSLIAHAVTKGLDPNTEMKAPSATADQRTEV